MTGKTSTTTATPETGRKDPNQDHGNMTDPQQQQPGVDTATEQSEPTEDQQDDGKGGGNKEAARYRKQLRAAEAERDELIATVENLRRQAVAGNMPFSQIKADALWATGRTAGEFFDEAGQLDAGKLSTITKETAATLGVPLQDVVRESGTGGGSLEPEPSWTSAVKRRS